MQEALLRRRSDRFTAGCPRNVSDARRQGREDRLESLHDAALAADHQAVTSLDSPHSPAGADIDVVNACFLELRAPANVVFVKRISTIDNRAPSRKNLAKSTDRAFRGLARRHHQPNGLWHG